MGLIKALTLRSFRPKSVDMGAVHSRAPVSVEPSYRYSNLSEGQIRLLILLPGPRKAPIRCSLRIVNLTDFDDRFAVAPQAEISSYEAISYCWKDVPGERIIDCDGHPLRIGSNLEIALRHFRLTDNSRVLWADGICINQKNEEEKSKQVSLMGLIYWISRKVLVWIGEETEATQFSARRAFTLMHKCSAFREELENNRANGHQKSISPKYETEDQDTDSWKAVQRLLLRNWFTRVWVVQELGLSRDAIFHCGDSSLGFEDMVRFLDFLTFDAPLIQSRYELSLQMLELARRYQQSTRGNHRLEYGSDPDLAEDFCDILGSARGLGCTDPKDAVYAFLGHPTAFKKKLLDQEPYMWYPRNYYEKKPTVVNPDYRRTTPTTAVYFEVARAMIQEHGLGMKVLQRVQHDQMTIKGDCPSWVPSWHMREAAPISNTATNYAAATRFPTTPFQVLPRTRKGTLGLRIQAISISTIYWSMQLPAEQELVCKKDQKTKHYYSPLEDLIGILDELQNDFPSQDHCSLRVLSTILTTGFTRSDEDFQEDINETNAGRHYNDFCAYRHYKLAEIRTPGTETNKATNLPSSEDSERGDAQRYMKSLRVGYRACFLTRRGRLGLGPRITQGGDQLWLPMGSDTPFVLRPLDDGYFRVIGQAYLHGVMRGEVTANRTEQDFGSITLV